MATAPDQVRTGLATVTAAAAADTRAVAEAGQTPSDIRAALFAAVPLIIGDYIDGSAALALDWYDEIREELRVRLPFRPAPVTSVAEDLVQSSVAWATSALYDLEQDLDRMTEQALRQATEESLKLLEPVVHKDVASGFWDTVTQNAANDPAAVGWQRFTRGTDACKFCRMLADKGAVYSEGTVDFAAHTSCLCVVAPSFDPDAPKASVMQYVASSRNRTPEQQAKLREYLNENFPDAPG